MKISEGTKISELIKFNSKAIDVIASINSHFEKLRNPILRKVLAPRVTIRDAAKIGGCSVDVFFAKLSTIGFEPAGLPVVTANPVVSSDFSLPVNTRFVSMDVRPDINSGKDPFLKIISALDALCVGECLGLINSFEPVPLIKILNEKKYECNVRQSGETVFTYILKTPASLPLQVRKSGNNSEFDIKLSEYKNHLKYIDVSSMEMPGPMLTILETLETLPPGSALHVQHRRVPQLLIPELKERGINILIKEIKEDSVQLLIFK